MVTDGPNVLLDGKDPLDAIIRIYRSACKLSTNELISGNPELYKHCKAVILDSGFLVYKLTEQIYKNAFNWKTPSRPFLYSLDGV